MIEKLRQEEGLARIPIVVVSGAPEAATPGRLPADIAVVRKGEGLERLLRELGQALAAMGHRRSP